MTTNLHAHVFTSAADCDGRYDRDYITASTPEEQAADLGDLDFKGRVMGSHVSFSPIFEAKMTITEAGFVVHEPTEEGYRHAEVTWCEDECEDESSYRDHTAESMGY